MTQVADCLSRVMKGDFADEVLTSTRDVLLARLSEQTRLGFRVVSTHSEPDTWMTAHVAASDPVDRVGRFQYRGIVSVARRDEHPHIDSVLLLFSHGLRVTQGELSILTAVFDAPSGTWSEFSWDRDLYSEWECDELPSDE